MNFPSFPLELSQIFELQSALEASEGKGTTFYSILNLTTEATAQEIKAAYRRRSVELHPDKHPDDPQAAKRFERLGLVNKILRDARKDRYDHFLSTGFPKWRGTGYYYQRFRPGIGSVLMGLVSLTVGIEYLVKRINYARDERRIQDLQKAAFLTAWGPRFYQFVVPGAPALSKLPPSEKKVKVPLNAGATLPPIPSAAAVQAGKVNWDQLEKKVRASAAASTACCGSSVPQRSVDLLVTREDDGESVVWVTDEGSGEWMELNAESALQGPPRIANAWPLRLGASVVAAVTGNNKAIRGGDATTLASNEQEAQSSAIQPRVNGRRVAVNKKAATARGKKGRK